MIQKIKPTKHLYKYQLREVASDTKDFETQKDSSFLKRSRIKWTLRTHIVVSSKYKF
jgi:hypothetical protein